MCDENIQVFVDLCSGGVNGAVTTVGVLSRAETRIGQRHHFPGQQVLRCLHIGSCSALRLHCIVTLGRWCTTRAVIRSAGVSAEAQE